MGCNDGDVTFKDLSEHIGHKLTVVESSREGHASRLAIACEEDCCASFLLEQRQGERHVKVGADGDYAFNRCVIHVVPIGERCLILTAKMVRATHVNVDKKVLVSALVVEPVDIRIDREHTISIVREAASFLSVELPKEDDDLMQKIVFLSSSNIFVFYATLHNSAGVSFDK